MQGRFAYRPNTKVKGTNPIIWIDVHHNIKNVGD